VTRASLREYAAVQRERYLRAPRAEKHRLLTEAVAVTGLHRKAAIRLLRRPLRPGTSRPRSGRPRRYGPAVAVVPTVMFKVLFVFVVLVHDRRRVVHINVTDAPTAQWTANQLVEAFPWETAPRYLLRDRDAVYGVVFSSRAQAMGIHEVKAPPDGGRTGPSSRPMPRGCRCRAGGGGATVWVRTAKPKRATRGQGDDEKDR
jgi:hypothetical protein